MGSTTDLKEYIDLAYLEYSMYVILDRALPHIGDGLKPVQRRIAYAMNELNLSHTAKFKKSARTIGDVLGKYHPHGDSACYGAMAMMAQPFSLRYPLVDGQGNWGSQDDPQSFAAMRYTEARLSPYSRLLLDELTHKPVPFKQNFDGTMSEPAVLPSQLPMILLNGTSGIAVGMATDIPPHNFHEVIDALVEIIDNPSSGLDEVMSHIQGPDYPTTASIISSRREIRDAYQKGYGAVRARSNYRIEGNKIIITDLPYRVSGEKLIEKIAGHVSSEGKQLQVIEDIQDQSDENNPVQIVIRLKKSAASQVDKVMSYLLAKTDLETSHRINFNVIGLDGAPKVCGLLEMLHEWLQFRMDTVRSRTQSQLSVIDARLHVIDGMLAAFLNLDEVIRIVREEDDPRSELIEALKVSEVQADAILNTRLARLAKLEEMALRKEQGDLLKEKSRLEGILKNDSSLKKQIKKELLALQKSYRKEDERCERQQPIHPDKSASAASIDLSDLAPSEPVRVVISKNGYIRSAKGHHLDIEKLLHKTGDEHLMHLDTKSNRCVGLLSRGGRVFSIPVSELPSARGYGEPVTSWIVPMPNDPWIGLFDPSQAENWLMSGSEGYGFVAPSEAFDVKAKKGKVLITKTDLPALPKPIVDQNLVLAMTSLGRALIFDVSELPRLEKGKGVKLVGTKRGETFSHIRLISQDEVLQVVTDKRDSAAILKPEDWEQLIGQRAYSARKIPLKVLKKSESIVDLIPKQP